MLQGYTRDIRASALRVTLTVQRQGDPLQDDTAGMRCGACPVQSDTIVVHGDTIV
jgi:hypothetical protein